MKIRTATGKEFDCGFWGEASAGVLYVIFENTNLADIAVIVSSNEELKNLYYVDENGNVVDTAENYTVLISMNNAGANAIRVGIRRPFVGEEA